MIKKKDINLRSVTKNALKKAFEQHGLLSEAELIKTTAYKTLPVAQLKSLKIGQADTPEAQNIDKVIKALIGSSPQSLDSLSQVVSDINNAIGVQEMKSKSGQTSFGVEEAGGQQTDLSKLAASIYLANFFHLVLLEQNPQTAGRIFETFAARLIGGSLPPEAGVAPIQDVIDGQNNYISIKALQATTEKLQGSKLGLAKGIIKNDKVHYLIVIKSGKSPVFKLSFFRFFIDKNNYFEFITSNSDAKKEKGKLSANIAAMQSKIVPKPPKPKKPKVTSESVDEVPINTILKGGATTDAELEAIRDKLRKEIDGINIDPSALNSFKRIFKRYLQADNKIKFPSSEKTIDLSSGENFKQSLKNLLIPSGGQKVISTTVFDVGMRPEFVNLEYEAFDTKQNVKNYDFNPKQPNTNIYATKIDTEIVQRNNQFENELKTQITKIKSSTNKRIASIAKELISKLENKSFYEIYLDEQLMKEVSSLEDSSLKTFIENEYKTRDDLLYKKEHKEIVKVFHQVFDPLITWFEEKKKSASTAKASVAAAARQQISQPITKELTSEIEQFWNAVQQYAERTKFSDDEAAEETESEKTTKGEGLLREARSAGPEGGQTQFAIRFEDLLSIGIELTKAADDLIISSVQTEKISDANERILKEYLEKYFDYFDKIKKSSDAYFYEDDGNQILTVSSTLLDFHDWINKTFVTQAGAGIKASSIKEDLNNLTKEARIVMEMLKKMEG